MGFFRDAKGQLTPQSLVRSGRISNLSEMFNMVVLVTCKNEDDPIKNEGSGVLTSLNINFQTLNGS